MRHRRANRTKHENTKYQELTSNSSPQPKMTPEPRSGRPPAIPCPDPNDRGEGKDKAHADGRKHEHGRPGPDSVFGTSHQWKNLCRRERTRDHQSHSPDERSVRPKVLDELCGFHDPFRGHAQLLHDDRAEAIPDLLTVPTGPFHAELPIIPQQRRFGQQASSAPSMSLR
jgi:hypothetical protein